MMNLEETTYIACDDLIVNVFWQGSKTSCSAQRRAIVFGLTRPIEFGLVVSVGIVKEDSEKASRASRISKCHFWHLLVSCVGTI